MPILCQFHANSTNNFFGTNMVISLVRTAFLVMSSSLHHFVHFLRSICLQTESAWCGPIVVPIIGTIPAFFGPLCGHLRPPESVPARHVSMFTRTYLFRLSASFAWTFFLCSPSLPNLPGVDPILSVWTHFWGHFWHPVGIQSRIFIIFPVRADSRLCRLNHREP